MPANVNDAVTASLDPAIGSEVVIAYVDAFRLGFRILAGIAVFELLICLFLAPVTLQSDTSVTSAERDEVREKHAQGEHKHNGEVMERTVLLDTVQE